jgi:hypothetical protein
MSNERSRGPKVTACLAMAMLAIASGVHANVVTGANARAVEIASTVRATPIAVRSMAIVQVSVFDAVQSITRRHEPLVVKAKAPRGASVEAAVAAATRTALLALIPDQKPAIEADYESASGAVPQGQAKTDGIAAGEQAAHAVMRARAFDGAQSPGRYLPRTAPGVYVPTTQPLAPHWGRRTPWLMTRGDQFRPAPPPGLDSDVWRRDLTESAAIGGRASTRRTEEQTAMARFWETTSPSIYWPVVRSVASARPADASDQTLLLAEAAMAMDDALIAVFDAKYAYEFWRPVTAIRNAPEGMKDPDWEPLIETPMHPEYPCAHCTISSAIAAVLESSTGDGPPPILRSTSPTAGGAERTWKSTADFVREVSEARIYAGVHYRNSTEVGQALGRQVGELAARRFPNAHAQQVKK